METYSEYQNAVSSEKTTLAILNASRRLIGFTSYSGNVYKISLTTSKIVNIKDSGSSYTEVNSISSMSSGSFYYDKTNRILYVQASDDSNPNSRILVLLEQYFFSNSSGIIASHDLSTGFDVEWTPMIEKTSDFGVGIDNTNQLGVAISKFLEIAL